MAYLEEQQVPQCDEASRGGKWVGDDGYGAELLEAKNLGGQEC